MPRGSAAFSGVSCIALFLPILVSFLPPSLLLSSPSRIPVYPSPLPLLPKMFSLRTAQSAQVSQPKPSIASPSSFLFVLDHAPHIPPSGNYRHGVNPDARPIFFFTPSISISFCFGFHDALSMSLMFWASFRPLSSLHASTSLRFYLDKELTRSKSVFPPPCGRDPFACSLFYPGSMCVCPAVVYTVLMKGL